ncbi:MAG: endonuclease/exonuclease/phosphatase family protein [Phycisphaerales bacterium]|nr:endonuclease/exonuclease/phosphatase family protein [Phycisphaerales bacterium]
MLRESGLIRDRIRWWGLVVVAVICFLPWAPTAQAQLRVVSYNVAQLRGDEAALAAVLSELSADDHAGPAYPVSILVFQEVTQSTFDALSGILGDEYSAASYTNSGEDNFGGAQAMFYRADTVTEVAAGHDGTYTGAGRRARRWQMRLVGYTNPVVDFYVYSGHLKAGNTSANQEERVFGINNILNNATEIPADSHVIICGDFNFYSANEDAYQTLISHESVIIIDPLGNDNWTGAGGAGKHTQSPRTISAGGLASGGLDDRFDFQVVTARMADGEGLALVELDVRSVGNDSQHYNTAINNGSNSYYPSDLVRSNALADALHDASDHLPVAADYMIPATVNASMFNPDLGTIIAGATVSLTVNIANECAPAYAGGGSDLEWYLDGTGTIDGVVGSGTTGAGESEWVTFDVTPGVGGAVSGELLVRSDGDFVQNEPASISISGVVLRHADASFSGATDVNWTVASAVVEADSGIQVIEVPIWNYGWDDQQAALDIDGVTGLDSPFTVEGLPGGPVTDTPGLLQFAIDTTGLAPGVVADALQVLASDEDLPGATDQVVNLSLSVTVEESPGGNCEGDINGSGQTDVEDLLIVLEGFGSLYDIEDVLLIIADWDCVG